ncbi:T9SS type B sorting domain-containing protein [Xanthomarina sp. F1114]|uniref:T9SS type B sorting domain-containing protein n=1 Tax=Xanthomarina sp. F1114 TaxID=2996019 RepID=UPI00225E30D6|nr:T9SS type B sorting domain-containing protein [Xanthomarina sp. F1114]MCX7547115.1 T9SS type B sorting domain-containing protein [Xanthomarina sp. F1114]
MKKFLFYIFFTHIICAYSQDEASNWYFGNQAGIQFNNNGTVTALTDGALSTIEGCTSISNADGELLFYTDGRIVYNKNHLQMQNGYGLHGNSSSTQSAIIIPKPDSPNIYYIFTQGTNLGYQGEDLGFSYSIVDMSLAGGLGAITDKNQFLLHRASEKLSAVLKDCESGNIWVITLADDDALTNSNAVNNNNKTFYLFEVSNTGIALHDTFDIGSTISERRGYLKFSPDGTKLVCASPNPNNINTRLLIFDFVPETGEISNPQPINITSNANANKPYGIEFSPNSQVLYVSANNDLPSNTAPSAQRSALLQYDLTAGNINAISASEVILESKTGYRSALQLGPDGKIYKTESSTYNIGLPYLSTIELPNIIGNGCNYTENTVFLNIDNSNRLARQGLPPFISSFFVEKIDIINNPTTPISTNYLPLCNGQTFTLTAENIPDASYSWTFNGTPLPNTNYFLEVDENGVYEVVIDLNNGDCDFLEGEAIIEYFTSPIANTVPKIDICDDNTDGFWQFDFTTLDGSILGTQDSNHYSVHYYESQEDANLNQNEIIGPYTNTSNPQEIFVKLDLIGSPSCFDMSSFFIEVFTTPIANPISNQTSCDDNTDGDASNGHTETSLLNLNNLILGDQDATAYSVSYHSSQADAEANINQLSEPYYNLTPFNETIFVRVENNLNSACFDITSFDLVVNPVPVAFNSTLIQCDIDGINDNLTTFNLNEAITEITGGNTNLSTNFYFNFDDAETSNDPLNAENYNNISNPQTLYAQVTDNLTGCVNIAELTLEVSSTQLLDYQVPEDCDELESEDGINSFNLDNIATEMQDINGITFPITFYSSYQDALLEQSELNSSYTNTTPYNQTIYARAENNNACYGISEVYLTINKLPVLKEDENTLYCLNSFPKTIILEAGVLNDSPANYTYIWSNGETTSSIQINQIGTYTVTVTNSSGCSKSRNIIVAPSNVATFNDIIVVDATENNTITVLVSGEGEYEYALYNQEGLYHTYQSDNIFYNVYGGIYTVAVRDIKNNCGIVTQDVSIIGFPKFFTPNGDGYNDTWNIKGVSNIFQPNTLIRIYDRYGKLIKQLNPLGPGWGGTFNGEPLPSDDYWFSATLKDGREFNSHFSLKR